jgi:transcriptional adapter 2-alpha
MQEVLMQEIFKGSVLKKEDAHVLFKVDPTKVDSVYDMVTKKLGNHVESPTV